MVVEVSAQPKYTRQWFQQEDIPKLAGRVFAANWSEVGCISGDAVISINRGGKGYSTELWKLHRKFHGLPVKRERPWDSETNRTYAQSVDANGHIRLNRILDVVDQGVKRCIHLTLDNGMELTCTPDHRLMLNDNEWVPAELLPIGTRIGIRGGKGGDFGIEQEISVSLGEGRFIDKDGYVKVKLRSHPRSNASGYVYEQIVVVESELGRSLEPYEQVHHKNEIRSDNRASNLEVTHETAHQSYHATKRGFGTFRRSYARIIKIEDVGERHVYDLVMEAPNHNFVANGVLVHNCMKTTTLLWDIQDTMKLEPPKDRGPRVLIITTKTGKGPYFQTVPHVLPGWSLANVGARNVEWLIGGNDPLAPRIVLAHYHCFTNRSLMRKPLTDVAWDMVAIDEAHRIKNRKSQWTKNIKHLTTKHRRVMTGTGFVNSPDEVWSLLNFLDKKTYSAYWRFRERYCDEIIVGGFRKIIGPNKRHLPEFRKLLADIGVRRTKKEVFKDLLDPIRTPVYVELSSTQRKMYNEIKNTLRTLDEAGFPIHSPNVVSALVRLRQIAVATPVVVGRYADPVTGRPILEIDLTEPSSKIDALIDILEGMEWDDDRRDSVVVFTQFAKAATLVEARLQKAGISYFRMLPKHNEIQRDEMVDAFQRQERQVFLSTIDLGGESITLTAAQTQINLDKSWSPGKNKQADGRTHRPGQLGQVQIIDIHAQRTIDDRVQRKLDTSASWFEALFG